MSDDLKQLVIEKIKTIFDPEIPVNVYDLGLIYDLKVDESNNVHILMTLTTPNCPVAEIMPEQIRKAVSDMDGVNEATIELTWEPQWSSEQMTEDARMTLDMMGISWKDPMSAVKNKTTEMTFGKTDHKPKG